MQCSLAPSTRRGSLAAQRSTLYLDGDELPLHLGVSLGFGLGIHSLHGAHEGHLLAQQIAVGLR